MSTKKLPPPSGFAARNGSAALAKLRKENASLREQLRNARREAEVAHIIAKTEHIGMVCPAHRGCAGEIRDYCPVCVREERDRYKRAAEKLTRKQSEAPSESAGRKETL